MTEKSTKVFICNYIIPSFTGTINSDCNITVIDVNEMKLKEKAAVPVLEKEKKDSESKDSKDGSDSGVEVCVTEIPRVRLIMQSISHTSFETRYDRMKLYRRSLIMNFFSSTGEK